jgi:hypothetical protein
MKNQLLVGVLAAFLASTAAPTVLFAHHGVAGQFDIEKSITVTGVVTRVRFTNPHSYLYFDSKNEAGETESRRCELRSGSLLKRKGFTPDLFPIGSTVTVTGSPDRRDPLTCYTETITFEDGRTLTRYDEIAADGSFIHADPDPEAEGEAPAAAPAAAPSSDAAPAPAATGDIPDLSGNWSEPVADGPPLAYAGPAPDYVLTQAAIDEGLKYTEKDNPRFQCKPTNIILDYRFDQMLNKIEQSATEVNLTYGFMDVARTIHIDGAFPDTIEPSVVGYSVGKWEDGKLHVTTKGFAPGFLEVAGGRSTRTVPHSDQMEIAETFYIDGNGELVQEYTITDPVYLAEPHSHLNKSVKTTDAFIPYDCDDLTEEN